MLDAADDIVDLAVLGAPLLLILPANVKPGYNILKRWGKIKHAWSNSNKANTLQSL